MSNTQTTIVLAPTTSAATSDEFIIGDYQAITVICTGLTGGETATVQFKNPLDDTWHDYYQNNVLIQFNSINSAIDVWNSAGIYRLNKSATASAVGVAVTRFLE